VAALPWREERRAAGGRCKQRAQADSPAACSAQAAEAEARYAALAEEHATVRRVPPAASSLRLREPAQPRARTSHLTQRHPLPGPAAPAPAARQVLADRDQLAAAAAAAERANTALWPLPLPVVHHIFSLLPLQTRLRCREVCRGWRAVLTEPSLWARLQLPGASGAPADADALLRCASACAAGGVQLLDVGGDCVSAEALLAAAAANAGALRELRVRARAPEGDGAAITGMACGDVRTLLEAAPQLRVLDADRVRCGDVAAACSVLRGEPPFAPLRVRQLAVTATKRTSVADEASVAELAARALAAQALAAAVAAHASLRALELSDVSLDAQAALDAVVDAALAARLRTLSLHNCLLSRASAPALARLLSSEALTTLVLRRSSRLLDAHAAALLGGALAANATLTSLTLSGVSLWADLPAAAALLHALHGHASLRTLCLARCTLGLDDQAAAGACLGALVAANAPSLTHLDISDSRARDDALRPLFEALPANAHLQTLRCCVHNYVSEDFQQRTLLPAVRANASLRALPAGSWLKRAVTVELNDIMQRRAAAAPQ
jgi:hypothetical protein